jgi:hypothetical protein
MIYRAYLAHLVVYIPWDAEQYFSEQIKGKKDPSRVKFPNPHFGAFSEPLTVVDSRGRIILWYLPGLLSDQHQVSLFFLLHFKLIQVFNFSRMFAMQRLALGPCLKSLQKERPKKKNPQTGG